MNAKMIVILTVLGLIVFFSHPAYSASKSSSDADKKRAASESVQPTVSKEGKALKSFNQIVNDFSKFFAANPKFISKGADSELYPMYTAEIIYMIYWQVLKKVTFDVRKTDSLVSPFTGYIDVEYIWKNNAKCGNVFYRNSRSEPVGFSSIDIALDRENEDSCFQSLMATTDRYEFAYQSGRWVLKVIKSIRDKGISENDFMATVLGMKNGQAFRPITEPVGLDFNKKWFVLVKPYMD